MFKYRFFFLIIEQPFLHETVRGGQAGFFATDGWKVGLVGVANGPECEGMGLKWVYSIV